MRGFLGATRSSQAHTKPLIPRNQTGFASLYLDMSKILQLSFEVDYRKTNFFRPLLTADGLIFMSEMLFRF
jgi:hypothetical protein